MNCLTDAAQENPNEGKRFSRRDGLTVQITCLILTLWKRLIPVHGAGYAEPWD